MVHPQYVADATKAGRYLSGGATTVEVAGNWCVTPAPHTVRFLTITIVQFEHAHLATIW